MQFVFFSRKSYNFMPLKINNFCSITTDLWFYPVSHQCQWSFCMANQPHTVMDPSRSKSTLSDLKPATFTEQHVRSWDSYVLKDDLCMTSWWNISDNITSIYRQPSPKDQYQPWHLANTLIIRMDFIWKRVQHWLILVDKTWFIAVLKQTGRLQPWLYTTTFLVGLRNRKLQQLTWSICVTIHCKRSHNLHTLRIHGNQYHTLLGVGGRFRICFAHKYTYLTMRM